MIKLNGRQAELLQLMSALMSCNGEGVQYNQKRILEVAFLDPVVKKSIEIPMTVPAVRIGGNHYDKVLQAIRVTPPQCLECLNRRPHEHH